MSMLERAEAAERAMSEELDRTVVKSVIYVSGDRDPRLPLTRPDNGKLVMMGQDPRLPRMPERPTLLDFFTYASVGYAYPQMYIKLFGADYEPDPYIQRDYAYAREHKWYMSARLICVNDLYAFDPNVKVELEEFTDVVGRHFRQPKEGLGWDASPSAHMWRTIMMPTKYL